MQQIFKAPVVPNIIKYVYNFPSTWQVFGCREDVPLAWKGRILLFYFVCAPLLLPPPLYFSLSFSGPVCSLFSPLSPTVFQPFLQPSTLQLKDVPITEWQFDTQWPVRTFISKCFTLTGSKNWAENKQVVSRPWNKIKDSLAPTDTGPLSYSGSVKWWLDWASA